MSIQIEVVLVTEYFSKPNTKYKYQYQSIFTLIWFTVSKPYLNVNLKILFK